MNLDAILESIERASIDESIQDMIRDMKATQHGDMFNPFYDTIKDKHLEGSVWAHTTMVIDALPVVAKMMGFEDTYEENKNELRSAALFHDIGKIATQSPSSQRPGIYTFPGHDERKIVKKLFAEYGLEDYGDDTLVLFLVTNSHFTPQDLEKYKREYEEDAVECMLILKAANLRATGPKSPQYAVGQMQPYLAAYEQEESSVPDIPELNEWSVEDVDWASQSKLGFVSPIAQGREHIARGVKQAEEPEDEGGLEFEDETEAGEAKLKVTVTIPHFKGVDFSKTMQLALKIRPAYKQEIEEWLHDDVLAFLQSQPGAPGVEELTFGEGEVPIDIALDKKFKVTEQTKKSTTFELYVTVTWG